ncbi:MAG: NTF2 fold immunity protein [Clostridia bacterium]
MSKRVVLVLFVVIVLIGGIILMVVQQTSEPEVKAFEISDYQYYINNFSSEKILGSVMDSEAAKKKAEDLWLELYGNNIKKKKPYQVFFDSKNEIWMIQGTLPLNRAGGVPYLLIEMKTGKVLAVWHDK